MTGPGVERNVVYGMYSGLALLLDIHRPERPKGLGVLFVGGSGWEAPLDWSAAGLKDKESQLEGWLPALLGHGFTVFCINHRAAPRFRYPAALQDVQRALRFVRCHSGGYGVDPARIGAVAGSSGAHLACLAAMMGAGGMEGDDDPVNRESATLQCLVLREAPTDLLNMAMEGDAEGSAYARAFMEGGGRVLPTDPSTYAEASPITYVSHNAPPVLLIHGDADSCVPYRQSVAMAAALVSAGVDSRLVTIPGGLHAPDFGAQGPLHPGWPDYLGEMVSWLDGHLLR